MLNFTKWFTNNYIKSEISQLNYNELLASSHLTSKNLEDFKTYSISKLDILKYILVLEYLFKNNEYVLAYLLNPYLIDKFSSKNKIFAYNDILDINFYKNVIIDLFFLDIPESAYRDIPLDILWSQATDKSRMDSYKKELKELQKMGYGFEYFGNKSMSLFFPLYFQAFYKNLTLYSYNDRYFNLGQILLNYSKDKLVEYSESTRFDTFLSNKIKNYSSFITKWDNLDVKSLDIISKIFKDILVDSLVVKQIHFEASCFVSPLEFQEMDNSYLADFCLLYNQEKANNNLTIEEGIPSENPSQVHEDTQMSLELLIESNLNSAY